MIKNLMLLFALVLFAACTNLPKDSLMRDVEIRAVHGTMIIGAAATGQAAVNLSAEEKKELLAPTTAPKAKR